MLPPELVTEPDPRIFIDKTNSYFNYKPTINNGASVSSLSKYVRNVEFHSEVNIEEESHNYHGQINVNKEYSGGLIMASCSHRQF